MQKFLRLVCLYPIIILFFTVTLATGELKSQQKKELNFSKLNIGDILKDFKQNPQKSKLLIKKYKNAIKLNINRTELNEILYKLFSQNSPQPVITRLINIIIKVKIAHLPLEPVINKIKEGLTKGATSSSIISSVSWKAKTLKEAKDILNQAIFKGYPPTQQELTIMMISDFLTLNISKKRIMEVMTRYKTQRNLYELKNLLIIEAG